MEIEKTGLPGVMILTPRRFGDARGFFAETWNRRRMVEAGIDADFVQDNHSLSAAPGTVRGLHFQAPPHAQGKLVRCGAGRLFDVVVDIRRGSPSYGAWFGVELSAENGCQLWIPRGLRARLRHPRAGPRSSTSVPATTRPRPRGRSGGTAAASTGA